jgi:hypothetical protein
MSTMGEAGLICRSVLETKSGLTTLLALSFVPAAFNGLVYALKLVAGTMAPALKLAAVYSKPTPAVVPT